MNKMLVIGCPGAGKSTFARRLQTLTGLPLCYLDMLWHRPDKTTVSCEEFDRHLDEWLMRERWIIDGNYLRTLEKRIQACDTIFFLDFPLEVCLEGVCSRIGRKREDMPWIEEELDEEFKQWILDFHKDQRPHILARLNRLQSTKKIFHLTSRSEIEGCFQELGKHMTTVYFVRHAEADNQYREERLRPLTAQGRKRCQDVADFLSDQHIDAVLSSPYQRAVDTVQAVAEQKGLEVIKVEAFQERRVSSTWIEDFDAFSYKQWSDFTYKLPQGESLQEVQDRNIKALMSVLDVYRGQQIVIGTHGTALSTILNYFDPSFHYEAFQAIKDVMPYLVKMTFCDNDLTERQEKQFSSL